MVAYILHVTADAILPAEPVVLVNVMADTARKIEWQHPNSFCSQHQFGELTNSVLVESLGEN
jgi:hypothetical protein